MSLVQKIPVKKQSPRNAQRCVKSVLIRSYSGPYFPALGLNTDQNNSEYGHILGSVALHKSSSKF